MKVKVMAVAASAAALVVGLPHAGLAVSATGAAQNGYQVCNGGGVSPNARTLVTSAVESAEFVVGQVDSSGTGDPTCLAALSDGLVDAVSPNVQAPLAVANTGLYSADSVDASLALVGAVAGTMVAQFDRISNMPIAASAAVSDAGASALRTYVGVPTDPDFWMWIATSELSNVSSAASSPAQCVAGTDPRSWCPRGWIPVSAESSTEPSPPADTTSHFTYVWSNEIPWDPGSNGKKSVNGMGWVNAYRADAQPDAAWDFWATAQVLSLTPVNGWRMKKVYTLLGPAEHVQRVDANPVSVNKYGSSGSISLGASLKGEANMGAYRGGADISIGRTWDVSEGSAGGAVMSDGSHYGVWQAGNKSGSSTAKAAEGVETWKLPPSDDPYFNWYESWNTQK